ncbi:MsnO8 family LLM class oxidoreductase [Enteractinococcus fodinae]|uniref:Luciferase family oxidoreductase group 1 n=1 Tax=Enteractinococcus fodinae TaxID=684663 RepID=A0ABU2B602_9MICC|nr:MsnO8 family LLM class oxidoreductase [Enteractinococcus fodinae]MDR7347814.1 luciferase family oxidoreductase group 1 [Enteractinococcus fodinae]
MSAVPLSILDRANTRLVDGRPVDASVILQEVTTRAQAAETLGYQRFWVAEHHAVPGIVGSTPTLFLAHLASATSTIRLGTGGIMVPSHQPLVIAEQIGTLQALYGTRIDAGLGASVGFTKPVREALRHNTNAKEHFFDDVDEVLDYLDGTAAITAYPQDESRTELHVLTSGGSTEFAATRGMGLVLGGPSVTRGLTSPGERSPVAAQYREQFVAATSRNQRPHVIASVNVATADSTSAAQQLVLSEAWALTQSRTTGVFGPLEDPATIDLSALSAQQQRRLDRALESTIYGTPDEVMEQLEAVVAYTQADEIMVTGNIWDPAAQLTSDQLLIEAWLAR